MTGSLATQEASILQFLNDTLRSSSSFVQQQAPDVVQQVLRWHFAADIVTLILCVLWMVAMPFVASVSSKKVNEDDDDLLPFWVILLVAGFVLSIICLITALFSIYDLIELCVAPKAWLLDYVQISLHQ